MTDVSEIVLASASARRKEILTHLGLAPRVLVSEADETVDRPLTPEMLTEELSLRKARAVMPLVSDGQLVIASDTVVAKGDLIFGKPHSESEAYEMLSELSGTTHKVVSGIALSLNGHTAVTHDVTNVTFRRLTDSEISSYVASGEPFDKAGGYGIQDTASVFIEKIDGEYFNVVGLPVYKMFSLLKTDFGLDYYDLMRAVKANGNGYKWKNIEQVMRAEPLFEAFQEYLKERCLDMSQFIETDEGRYLQYLKWSAADCDSESISFDEWKKTRND